MTFCSFIGCPHSYICSTTAHIQKLISKVCAFSVCFRSLDEDGNTPLHIAASCGNLPAVEAFLEWQDRNQQDERLDLVQNAEGKTPAHVAAERNHSK